jgi:hypothetical protein
MLKAVRAFMYQGVSFAAGAEIPPLAIEADDLAIFLARGVVIETAKAEPVKPLAPKPVRKAK